MENLDEELKFIKLLNLEVKSINDNRWEIIDKSKKNVGFIQKKKIKSKNKKKNLPALYRYQIK